jgi:hypothetical protein
MSKGVKNDGVIQMYLNNVMFINFYDDEDNDFKILCKTLRQYSVYNKDEKNFMNIKPNSSFDKLKDMLQLSPISRKQPSPLTITIPSDEKNNSNFQKLMYKFIKNRKFNTFSLRKQKSRRFNILNYNVKKPTESTVNI